MRKFNSYSKVITKKWPWRKIYAPTFPYIKWSSPNTKSRSNTCQDREDPVDDISTVWLMVILGNPHLFIIIKGIPGLIPLNIADQHFAISLYGSFTFNTNSWVTQRPCYIFILEIGMATIDWFVWNRQEWRGCCAGLLFVVDFNCFWWRQTVSWGPLCKTV